MCECVTGTHVSIGEDVRGVSVCEWGCVYVCEWGTRGGYADVGLSSV